MRRYGFLDQDSVFEALNKLRHALLAAKDGNEVEEVMSIFTSDERMKIGRRIKIAQELSTGKTLDQISQELKVGKTTINQVVKMTSNHPLCFQLIEARESKVEREFKQKAYVKVGGSKLIFKKTEYTGFKRKDVKR